MKLNALTSLRFFAAYMIVIHHTPDVLGRDIMFLNRLPLDQAVSFFFVLSGFILMYVHPRVEGTRGASKFLLARVARLWPLHLLTGVIFFIALRKLLGMGSPERGLVAINTLMIQSWIPLEKFYLSFNALSWAVSTEFFFYLCYPWLARKFARTWHVKLAASFGLIALISLLLNTYGDEPGYGLWGISADDLLYINPLGRLFEFVLGMCMGHFFNARLETTIWTPARATAYEAASAAAVLAGLLISIPLANLLAPSLGAFTVWFVHSGTCIFFALMAYAFAFGRGYISRAISIKPLVTLGEMSYAIYLLHQILLLVFGHIKKGLGLDALSGWPEYGFYLALMFSISYLLWRFVENPARKLILHLAPKKA